MNQDLQRKKVANLQKCFLILSLSYFLIFININVSLAQSQVSNKSEKQLYVQFFLDLTKFKLKRQDLVNYKIPTFSPLDFGRFKSFSEDERFNNYPDKSDWEFISNVDSIKLNQRKINFNSIKSCLKKNKIILDNASKYGLIFVPTIYSPNGDRAVLIYTSFFMTGPNTAEKSGTSIYLYQFKNNNWEIIHSEALEIN